ncbi:hypothetical protein RHSIM_Rhsim06G0098300 [Rhododendron simsii]|uniref:PRA1 family protein n=1 Tax=Rhododendron simsii TaxID=118357 RepID=A0A834H213_RHOSS|nr:hypothetical protein RHSIM_Rhsim06G0098300 [Rhododendron simsii]
MHFVDFVSGFSLLTKLFAWIFLYLFHTSDPPLVILGRAFSKTETLGLHILSSIVVVFLINVRSVLSSTLMVGIAIFCIHGAFRAPRIDSLTSRKMLLRPTSTASLRNHVVT